MKQKLPNIKLGNFIKFQSHTQHMKVSIQIEQNKAQNL